MDSEVEKQAEKNALRLHEVDSVSLMLFCLLLILTVLTTWLFKHRQFKFVHESGVTLIYGAIVGLILYVSGQLRTEHDTVSVVPASNTKIDVAKDGFPLHVRLTLGNYSYPYQLQELHGEVITKNTTDKEQSFIEQQATFQPELFYNLLLPPIIFHAGYGMKKKQFFRNIGSIMTFAFIGTTISCFFVGYVLYLMCMILPGYGSFFSVSELLFFGALISATDPVTVLAIFSDLGVEMDLYAIVFGESVLNDAVAIVLSKTVEDYMPSGLDNVATEVLSVGSVFGAIGSFFGVFIGSFAIGAVIGCICALFTKFTKISEYPLLETSLFLLMSYLSFLVAESCGMTGIVSILFCGMCQAHYTFNNLSQESKSRTKEIFEAMNFLSEGFIFTYIGVSLFTSHTANFDVWFNMYFSLMAIIACVVARMIHIYGLSALLNIKRKPKITWSYQHMLVFAGLRGAIAYTLAVRNTATAPRQQIYTATSIIVAVTIVLNGGFTKWMIEKLHIRYGIQSERELQPQLDQQGHSHEPGTAAQPKKSVQDRSPQHQYNPWDKSALPRKCYMKPFLTNSRPTLMETLPQRLQPLARLLTTTEQMMNTEPVPRAPGDGMPSDDTTMDDLDHVSVEVQPTRQPHII